MSDEQHGEHEKVAARARGAAPGRSRGKLLLIAVIVLAAVAALAAATQGWIDVQFKEGAAALSELSITGQALNPSLSPIALAALAAALVLTIAGPVFRRILGALVLLLGAGIVAMAVFTAMDPRGGASWPIARSTGLAGAAQERLVQAVDATAWPLITAIAGAVLILAGLGVLIVAGGWRAAGRRYQASSERGPRSPRNDEPDRISDWDALSGGDDPSEDARS